MILNFEETFSKNYKIGEKINLDNHSNNEELFYNKINNLKKQNEDISQLAVEKFKSSAIENSKNLYQKIDIKDTNRLNSLILEKKNTSHTKVLSMPKLTINNNVINNITVINNGKTMTTQNKSLLNEIGKTNFSKKNLDFTKNNLNILNQKYTRNERSINNLASINSHNNFNNKPMNTLDLAKEMLYAKNKFVITNYNSKATLLFNKEPLHVKNQNSITSRKVPNPVHLYNQKNFQTIDVINQVMSKFKLEK